MTGGAPDRPGKGDMTGVLMALARARGPGKSFCPSEAARALAEDWRPLMPELRALARELPLVATQAGRAVDPVAASGPIRLSLAPGAAAAREARRGGAAPGDMATGPDTAPGGTTGNDAGSSEGGSGDAG